MAGLSGSDVHRAIRQRINGILVVPTPCHIDPGVFNTDLPAGSPLFKTDVASIQHPAVTITTGMSRSPETPYLGSNVALLILTVIVRTYYNLTSPSAKEDVYQAARAQALSDAETIRQALGYPGALSTTAQGAATGIVSGLVTLSGDHKVSLEDAPDVTSQLVTESTYTGWLLTQPAIS